MDTLDDIDEDLGSPQWRKRILGYQIVHAGFGITVAGFAAVVAFVIRTAAPPEPPDAGGVEFLRMLSLINAAAACALILLAWGVPGIMLSPRRLAARIARRRQRDEAKTVPMRCFEALVNASIVRGAHLEAAGTFGLVVCLVGGLNGVIQSRSEFWWNAAPAAAVLCYVVYAFPTRSRIAARLGEILSRVRPLLDEPAPQP